MGFDEESNRHQVYWAEKRSVTVERGVTFVSVADNVALEREFEKDEPSIPTKLSQCATVEDAPNDDEPTTLNMRSRPMFPFVIAIVHEKTVPMCET